MSTLLLNHFNGTDGATTFTDEVPGITWSKRSSPYGGLGEIDTAFSNFGGAALYIPAGASSSNVRGVGITSPHAGSFTLEGWIRWSNATFSCNIYGNDASDNFQIQIQAFGSPSELWAYASDSGGTEFVAIGGTTSLSTNTFHHVALVRDVSAGTYSLYCNGVRTAQASSSTNPRSFDRIECQNGSSVANHWFEETRVTNEVKYSGSTYTVPSAEFTLGTTTNIEAFGAEFDHESDLAALTTNIVVDRAEFDFEAQETTIRLTQSDPQSLYVWEGGSPSLVHTHILSVDNLEADWELSLEQQSVPGGFEFDWEAPDVGIPIDSFIGANETPLERDWEALSVNLFSRNLSRGVTPHRRRIVAGRRSIGRRMAPQLRVEVTASRRTEVLRE